MNRAGFTYTWHQDHTEPFDEAEFYENGTIVTVRLGFLSISVDRDGESDWSLARPGGETIGRLRTAREFRSLFPEGQLPEDGKDGWAVRYNGWFDLYDATEGRSDDPNEWPIPSDDGHIDNVAHSLKEAIADAERILEEAPLGGGIKR